MNLSFSKSSVCGLGFVLMAFISMNPFIFWNDAGLLKALFFLLFILGVICSRFNGVIGHSSVVLVVAFLAIYLLMYFPFREYDYFRVSSIPFLLVGLVLFVDKRCIEKSLIYYVNLMFVISVLSLLSWCLYLINIPYFEVTVPQDFRRNINDSYSLYWGVVILSTQVFDVYGGISSFRSSGVFAEPGHFSMYLSLALALMERPLSNIKGLFISAAIVTTFSVAGYIALLAVFLYRYRIKALLFGFSGIFLLALFVATATVGADIIDTFILSKIYADGGILDSRTRYSGGEFWEQQITSVLLGMGNGYVGINEWVLSDFRSYLYKYGVLACLILFFIFFFIWWTTNPRRAHGQSCGILVMALLVLILVHRSWMVDSFLFFYFLFAMHIVGGKESVDHKAPCSRTSADGQLNSI